MISALQPEHSSDFGMNGIAEGRASRKDLAIVAALTILSYIIFTRLDPTEMLSGDINPWDSGRYKEISDRILADGPLGLSGVRPFCYRIVQPALATITRQFFGSTYAEASHVINSLGTLFVSLFSFSLWRHLGLSRPYCYAGIAIITTSSQGPLRHSIYYPGGQFAFEILTTCIAFWSLRRLYTDRTSMGYLLPALALFTATLGREHILYVSIIVALFYLALPDLITRKQTALAGIFSIIPSLLGFLAPRLTIAGTGEYSTLSAVERFGYFHLNIGEDFYMYFYSFGPLFLFSLLCFSFSVTRKALLSVISPRNSIENSLIVAFCLSSFLFALVGGTDSDRFLMWAFPFYFFVGLSSLRILMEFMPDRLSKQAVLSVFILTAALWSRFYVPAIPHLLFTDKFNSQENVKTNLNPDLYRGPPFLESLREKLVEVSPTDAYNSERVGSRDSLPRAFVPEKFFHATTSLRDKTGEAISSPIRGSYRFAANNIPFPLGFPHNQNEILAIHPYHGNFRLRALLLAQWLGVYFLSLVLINRSLLRQNTKVTSLQNDGE